MNKPKFNPGLWLLFKVEGGEAFGKITGGNFKSETGWTYFVDNASDPGKNISVAEVDIIATSEGVDWTEIK